jgi:predicted molibdopterin-dependent oxidoreductase YjgC
MAYLPGSTAYRLAPLPLALLPLFKGAGRTSLLVGLTTTEILGHVHEGGIRALYIMGENPMMSEPNINETRKHMTHLEFLVAQDLFINESGAFADVFLPAASFAEKDGTFTTPTGESNECGRLYYPAGWRVRTGKFSAT